MSHRNDRLRGHKLLTKTSARKLPALYSQEDKGGEAIVQVKFFSATGWTWYATEASAILPDGEMVPLRDLKNLDDAADVHFFGLVIGFEPELGTFNLHEMEAATYEMLPGVKFPAVERDLHWEPRPLGEIARQHNTHRFLWLEDPPDETPPPNLEALLDQAASTYDRLRAGDTWQEFTAGRAVMDTLREHNLTGTTDERTLFKQIHSALHDRVQQQIENQKPAATPSFSDLFVQVTGALNQINRARNAIGSLDLSSVDSDQVERAQKAYDLICQAEGLLEAIRDELPPYDEGA